MGHRPDTREYVFNYRGLKCSAVSDIDRSEYPPIFLLLNEDLGAYGHYCFVTNPRALVGSKDFCLDCLKPNHNGNAHKCIKKCKVCWRVHDDMEIEAEVKTCDNCNIRFKDGACFDNHIMSKECMKYWKCLKCDTRYERKHYTNQIPFYFDPLTLKLEDIHECDDILCSNCKGCFRYDHQCCIKKVKPKPPCQNIFIYDMETYIVPEDRKGQFVEEAGKFLRNVSLKGAFGSSSVVEKDSKSCVKVKHEVALICVSKMYSDEEWCFERLEDFVSFIIANGKSTFIAHNSRAYDGYFLLEYFLANGIKTNVVRTGGKVLLIELNNKIRLIDSLSFIATSLRSMPREFGLDVELLKGYFPYKALTRENFKSEEPLSVCPPEDDFIPYTMSDSDYKDFKSFYDSIKNEPYHIRRNLIEYCRQDVMVLKKVLEIFRESLWKSAMV